MEEQYRKLIEQAMEARTWAYAPYSHYLVGAALLCADGTVSLGCNIENASYGATVCAERTALYGAVAQGKRHFDMMALVSGPEEPEKPEEPKDPEDPEEPAGAPDAGDTMDTQDRSARMVSRGMASGNGHPLLPWPSPCGICRQALREFVDPTQFRILLARSVQEYRVVTLEELLPESFGPEYL